MAQNYSPLRYLANLTPGKAALWCYLIWYLVTAVAHFDPSPGIWLSSLGISAVVGVALLLSVAGETSIAPNRWQTFRLFLMPFCVSSFSALIKGQNYILILPSRPLELCISIGICAAFVVLILGLKRMLGKPAESARSH
jgi:hypothetical protein